MAGGNLIHSRDGGLTWHGKTNNLPPERIQGVRSLAFVDPQHGWMAGTAPVPRGNGSSTSIPFVLRTTNAGGSWVEQILPGVSDEPPFVVEGEAQRIVVAPPMHALVLGHEFQPSQAFGYAAVDGGTWEESELPEFGTTVTGLAIVP